MGILKGYRRLLPPESDLEEYCSCDRGPSNSALPPVKLMTALGKNPIHCMKCNRAVSPRLLTLNDETFDEIARWNDQYNEIYSQWLDSKENEDSAKAELSDIESVINAQGRKLAREIADVLSCYYWIFWDETEPWNFPKKCPVCGGSWRKSPYRPSELLCGKTMLVAAARDAGS